MSGDSPGYRMLATVITLAGMAVLVWMEAPEWQREALKRTVRFRAYRMLHRLARASGRRAMGEELRGRALEAETGYAITYRLSSFRDRV